MKNIQQKEGVTESDSMLQGCSILGNLQTFDSNYIKRTILVPQTPIPLTKSLLAMKHVFL